MKVKISRWRSLAMKVAMISSIAFLGATANAQQPSIVPANNPELRALYNDDQSDRTAEDGEINWNVVNIRDATRRERLHEILRSGEIRTALDYYHAAMIFQHGESTDDLRLAWSLAWIAATMDPSSREAMWLSASAFDRLMMREKQPQWYGTQAERKASDGDVWRLYPVLDGAVDDEERARFGLPPLETMRQQIEGMNETAD